MSRWWADQIRIVLHPEQVVVLRLGKGRKQRILDKHVVACTVREPDTPPWHGALCALMSVLPEFSDRKCSSTVVLSNHFVRYVLVNHTDQISSAEEERALVQHHFSRIYGSASANWNLSISQARYRNCPQVACAIDQELIDALRKLLQPVKPVLRSIQPYLMTAFNQFRHCLTQSAWLALVEDGILCLARLEDNCWQTIKCIRIGNDWRQELAIQLDREELLSGRVLSKDEARMPVFVFAPEYPEPINVTPKQSQDTINTGGSIHILDPSLWPKPSLQNEPAHAMALIG